jgi:hypothetical protein
MAFVVVLVGGTEVSSWHFNCSKWTWDQTLQLARENGWEPVGTTPDPVWKKLWDDYGNFPGDYECDEGGKVVCAKDAAALADALERASQQPLPEPKRGPVLIRENMTANQYRQANQPLGVESLSEFINFLRHGEFSFFWDD